MTIAADALLHLPEELKQRRQWALAGASKAPLSVGNQGKLYNTSVTAPMQWLTFEDALQAAQAYATMATAHTDKMGRTTHKIGLDIGYILDASDPFSCVDLDVKDAENLPDEPLLWTPPERLELFGRVAQQLDSYTELSRSGKGLHIWVRGKIGRGFKRDGIELYSQERFIICTGRVVYPKPIAERQELLSNMASQMRPNAAAYELEEIPEEVDDWYILNMAVEAGNSDKFIGLWNGEWVEMGFPSQSEADLALMSMLTFYSPSNAQCKRLFRESKLGKRTKAVKDDRYINSTIRTIRDRERRDQNVDVSAMQASLQAVQQAQAQAVVTPVQIIQTNDHMGQGVSLVPKARPVFNPNQPISWPPGLLGEIAQFIYHSSHRPVKEVSIVSALGLLAGLTGKAWHIPGSGLNLYIILIARSAVGKEGMHSGISRFVKACLKDNAHFHKYVDFTEYVSGPALVKACANNPCFVNVSDEWGRKLKRLAIEDGRDSGLQTLRTQMVKLYQKSGPEAIVGGLGYSTQENNIASVAGVSYSMIGETTPGTFYEAINSDMMEDGFMSRFLLVEYNGERPAANANRVDEPLANLVQALNAIAIQADMMLAKGHSMPIGRSEDAAELMGVFEAECDMEINKTKDEAQRQMWNRAALKATRVAAILAVADNWVAPVIQHHHVEWAQALVKRDISLMGGRILSGDVGRNDDARVKKLVWVINQYLQNEIPRSYKISDKMRQEGIIPYRFMQTRVSNLATFKDSRMGSTKMLNDAIVTCIEAGYMMEVKRDKLVENYNFHGKAYRVIHLPDIQ